MNRFHDYTNHTGGDDRIAEEKETFNEELLALLRDAYRGSKDAVPQDQRVLTDAAVPEEAGGQEEIVARVRKRLLDYTQDHTPAPGVTFSGVDTLPRAESAGRFDAPGLKQSGRKRARVWNILASVAAVLVVALIGGSALLLFQHRPQITSYPGGVLGPVGAPVVVSVEKQGLKMSMRVTGGPYFLSEIVEVELSLTNNSQNSFLLRGKAGVNPCGSTLSVQLTGGTAPHAPGLPMMVMSCPYSGDTTLIPGQTITANWYVPLPDSGDVTLQGVLNFLQQEKNGNQLNTFGAPGPLTGHEPTLRMHVAPRIPADRQLSVRVVGQHVEVNAPPAARAHLLYLYIIDCQDNMQGTTMTGSPDWAPIASTRINLPSCSETGIGVHNIHWSFAVGAVGYMYATGHYAAA